MTKYLRFRVQGLGLEVFPSGHSDIVAESNFARILNINRRRADDSMSPGHCSELPKRLHASSECPRMTKQGWTGLEHNLWL